MAEETGFFRFDTNIDAVVSDIEGGLRRLNGALKTPLSDPNLAFNTRELQSGLQKAENLLTQSQQRLRDLFALRGAGLIDRPTFEKEVRGSLRGSIGSLPQLLTEELSRVPPTVANTAPVKGIAKFLAQDFVATLGRELDAGMQSAGGKVRSIERFQSMLQGYAGDLTASPLVTGSSVSELAHFSTIARAEDLVAANLQSRSFGQNQANSLGLGKLFKSIFDTQVDDTEDGGVQFQRSDAARRLAELGYTQSTGLGNPQDKAERAAEERTARETIALQKRADGDSAAQRRDEERTARETIALQKRADGDSAAAHRDEEKVARETVAIQKRADQDSAGAHRDEERLAREISAITRRDLGDKRGNRLAEEKLAREISAIIRRDNQEKLATARETLALQKQQAKQGFVQGVQDRFHRGQGDVMYGLGNQFGSALGFSLAYGSLFALQGAIRDTLSEFLDYQDSVTDLEVATRGADVVTAHWVNSLSELSRVSGDNVGAALDAAARGVRAFTTSASTDADVERAGFNTAKTATRLALIANKPLPDATGDVIASGSAFGLAPDQLEQVVDAVANAKRSVGGDANQISQGLSLIALSAQEAGYDLNQAAAVIGLVQARTDQSGQAIATRLTRIFQIVQGSTGKRLAQEFGVDPTASVKERIEAFAKIYADQDTSEATRNRIASALGGTANLRELLPLLKENTTLQEAYRQAITNSGQGTDEYNRKTQNLVGTLKKIAADIKNIQVGLGKSGLFDFIGAGFKTIEPALHGLNDLIAGYNELTDGHDKLKALVGTTIALGLAVRGLGGLKSAGFFKGAAAGLGDAGLGGRGLARAGVDTADVAAQRAAMRAELAVMEERLIAEGRFNEAIAVAAARRATVEAEATAAAGVGGVGGAGKLGKFGAGLGVAGRFLLNPWTLGIGAVVGALALYGVAREHEEQKQNVLNVSRDSLQAFSRLDGSSAAFRAAAQDMNTAVGEIKKSPVSGTFKDDRSALANAAKQRREVLVYLAHQAEYDERAAAAAHKVTIFGTGAIETMGQLADGLSIIAQQGGTGLDQWNMLVKGLTTPPPPVGTEYFTPKGLNNSLIGAIAQTARRSIPEGYSIDESTPPAQLDPTAHTGSGTFPTTTLQTGGSGTFGTVAPAITAKDLILNRMPLIGYENGGVRSVLELLGLDKRSESTGLDDYNGQMVRAQTAKKINQALNKAQRELGLVPSLGVTDAQKEELLKVAFKKLDFSKLGKDAQEIADAWFANSLGVLKDSKIGSTPFGPGLPNNTLNGEGPLNSDQVMQLLNPEELPGGEKPPSLQDYMDGALASIPASDDGSQLEAVQKGIAKFLSVLVRRNRASGEEVGVLTLMQNNAWDAYKQTQIENLDDLRQAAESRAKTNQELRAIRLKYAKQEFDKAGTNKNLIESLMESMDRQTIRAVIAYVRTARDVARTALQHARAIIRASQAVLRTAGGISLDLAGGAAAWRPPPGVSTDMLDALKAAQGDFKKRRKQLDALWEVFNGPANVTEEKASLPKGAAGKSPEDLAAERRAAAEEHLNNAIDALQLTGDFTDPVEQARDALRAAKMRYAFEKTPGNLFDIRQSAAALEKAKWDQKLSDMQTAEQLGRISYATYVRFLQNESDRMHKMNHKTRQQIDQMNEIDLALKETTASMEGQFNLGDIDTKGFVYAVRRMMGGAGGGNNNGPGGFVGGQPWQSINNNQHIEFHGIGERTLRRVLSDLLGGVPIHTTTSRKVA